MKVIAAGIFIMRNDGKLLICHPTHHPEDIWSIPKGKVEEGETKLEAALRETEEETNLWLGSNDNFVVYDLERLMINNRFNVVYHLLGLVKLLFYL